MASSEMEEFVYGVGNDRAFSGVKLGWQGKVELFMEENRKTNVLKRIQKLEDRPVPGGKEWRIEGRKMQVTRKEFQRLKGEFGDTSCMAQRGMWHFMEQRIRDTRTGGMEERENVFGECNAMAEDELWSGWNQVKRQVHKISQGDWRKPKR